MIYVASDFVACVLAMLLFNLFRYWRIFGDNGYGFAAWVDDPHVMLGYVVFPALMVAVFALFGFYNDPQYKSRYDSVANATAGAIVGSLLIYFIIMVDDSFDERSLHYSVLLVCACSFVVCVSLSRMLVRAAFLHGKSAGRGAYGVIIVGPAEEAVRYARRVEDNNRRMGYRVAAIVATDGQERYDSAIPCISYAALPGFLLQCDVKAFIVMASRERHQDSVEAINRVMQYGKTVLLPIGFYNVVTSRPKLSNIIGEPLVDITSPSLTPANANMKRIGDVIASAVAMLVLAPLIAALAVAIKLDSKGPVFYRQERVGLHRRTFKIVKLRTMVHEAEPDGPALSSEHDPRVTRIGKTLRKYRLDELPQFWNVFCGDMSLVGPRPERSYFLDRIVAVQPAACALHNVRPGITSLGMVKYGYASDVSQMIERLYFDLLYIENVSLSLDIKIMFHTVNTVITGKGI